MNKLKEIIYKIRLNSVDKKLTENAENIETAFNSDNDFIYNHYRLEQLRLMSNRSYLENKLSCIGVNK